MDRTAVMVDAGYLFASGSKLLANEKLPRSQLNLDYDAVLRLLTELCSELTSLPLLRVYWYDGTSMGPTRQQLALSYRPNIKLRLGFLSQRGEQRGVDSLMISDMLSLARNRAVADILLLTGDEDLCVGMQQAQDFGVRVHLLGIAPCRENQSGFLVQEADGVHEIGLAEVQSFLSVSSAGAGPELTSLSDDEAPLEVSTLEVAAQRIAEELRSEDLEAVLQDALYGLVPSHVDRRLLLACGQALGSSPLTREQKRHVRAALVDACRRFHHVADHASPEIG